MQQYKHDYHINHIETIHEQKKDYYQENKEYTLNKAKEYYEQNTEKCKERKNKCFAGACEGAHTNSTKVRLEKNDYFNSFDDYLLLDLHTLFMYILLAPLRLNVYDANLNVYFYMMQRMIAYIMISCFVNFQL